MAQLDETRALIYIMVTIAAADAQLSDRELNRIGVITDTLPVFEGIDRDVLVEQANACSAILADEDGLDTILTLIHDTIPPRLYETAYAVGVEITAADLDVKQEELRFLQMLRDALDLDPLVVAAIEHSARVRFRLPSID